MTIVTESFVTGCIQTKGERIDMEEQAYSVVIIGMEQTPPTKHYHKTLVAAEAQFNVWRGLVRDGVADRAEVRCCNTNKLLHVTPQRRENDKALED